MGEAARPDAIPEALWPLALAADVSAISDVLNARGIHNKALDAGVVGVAPEARIVGLARTMRSRARETAPDAGREYAMLFDAIDGLGPGEVLVTDAMGCCVWGELCCERAIRRRAAGALVDGYHRDTRRIVASGFPVFSRGRHPSDMLYHREIVAVNAPVHCGGVYVEPGDLVIADIDGVVVVPRAVIGEVVVEAGRKAGLEDEVRAALREGTTAAEAFRRFGVF
jgi:4-hydroxy-4-methyl-2-oxoglutarate aldolase